jgi:low affinity Fe/Cu permease
VPASAPTGRLVVGTDGYRGHMTNSEHPPIDEAVERQHWLDQKRRQVEDERSTGNWRQGLTGSTVASNHGQEWEQRHWTSRVLHRIGEVAGHSGAGIAAAILVVIWAVVGLASGFPVWWQTVLYGVTGSVTFVMVFVIQHAHERQTSGTQRKLDELIRSSARADNSLIAVEEAADEHLQALARLNHADRERAAADEER